MCVRALYTPLSIILLLTDLHIWHIYPRNVCVTVCDFLLVFIYCTAFHFPHVFFERMPSYGSCWRETFTCHH